MRRLYRIPALIALLLGGLATVFGVFPLVGDARREWLIANWSRLMMRACGAVVREMPVPGAQSLSDMRGQHGEGQGRMLLSNHISWLDIFVINTIHPCRFVAKSDIRSWPLIGWLCHKTGTIFIARGKQSDVRRIYAGLVKSIHDGERVAFFPEGTTASQGTVLPFHANLFEAAIEAQVPVQPYALRYVDADGKLHNAADFIGEMTFVESVIAIVKSGGIQAELIRLPALPTQGAHRRELAVKAREMIASVLIPTTTPATIPAADVEGNLPAPAVDHLNAAR